MIMGEEGPRIHDFQIIRDSPDAKIVQAAQEAALEALANFLLKASPVHGREARV
jgi:hypothetical protein